MSLIATLPQFFKDIENDYADMTDRLTNFVNSFKDINLGDTWV
jgi:hypothetical protein